MIKYLHEKKLPPQRAKIVKIAPQKRKKRVICDRIKTVLLSDEGYSYSEISRILLLDDETIRRHVDDYFKKNKFKGESGGSNSQLSVAQSDLLCAHLNKVTYFFWVKFEV